jgi:predicted glycosyltransferase
LNLLERSRELKKYIKNKPNGPEGIKLAVSHGSRTQLVAANGMKIRTLLMMDYEYTETRIFNRYADHILVPDIIPPGRLSSAGISLKKVIRYKGFKEELYLCSFKSDGNFRSLLEIEDDAILAVIRPPGMLGNYHDSRSETLLMDAIEYFASFENCVILITSRSQKDRDFINQNVKSKSKVIFLEKAVDGLQLVSTADIVLSGGGTMNREAALIGTKTYSIFTGKRPYLDEHLESHGRLTFINSKDDITQIKVERIREKKPYDYNKKIVNEVTDIIVNLMNKTNE